MGFKLVDWSEAKKDEHTSVAEEFVTGLIKMVSFWENPYAHSSF